MAGRVQPLLAQYEASVSSGFGLLILTQSAEYRGKIAYMIYSTFLNLSGKTKGSVGKYLTYSLMELSPS
jgi:hypothetical protein